MSAEQLLVKLDFTQYEWKDIPARNGADGRGRRIGGGEVAQEQWNRLCKGDQTLFFATYVKISTPVTPVRLIQASRDAWIHLRHQLPTVACSLYRSDDNFPCMAYYTDTTSGIYAWAERTLDVTTQAVLDLDHLRCQVGQEIIPSSSGDQTWMHVVLEENTDQNTITNAGFLFHSHHEPFDGTALKTVMNFYLRALAKALSGEDVNGDLQWGKEFDNLPPSAFNVLDVIEPLPIHPRSMEEPSFQHPFYGTLATVMQSIGEAGGKPYGFRPRNADPGWPNCRREGLELTKEESNWIISRLKRITSEGAGFSVTHLAHTALAMAAIFNNPPKKEDSSLVLGCFSLANCRNRFREPYSGRDGYAGYALGVSESSIPVALFLSEDGQNLPLDQHLLAKVLKTVRGYYNTEKNMACRIAYMAVASDIFASFVESAIVAGPLPPNQCFSFSSDGIGESHLDATFTDSSGREMINIMKFFTALNRTDPGPFFRISSWKGVIDLGGDFNSNLVSVDEMKGHIAKWKEFMFLISELDGEI